ncbi:hypothetical protein KI387_007864, partial [Taxus chinensis]
CRVLIDAGKEFQQVKERDSFSWNTIIAAYKRHGYPYRAVTLFHSMQETGLQPDQFTFANILPACVKIGTLEQGMGIHQSIDMYEKCGIVDKARELFDRMPQKNVGSWK